MTYDIDKGNLQGAYLKLKHYMYYYGSSSYLKKEMLAFEKNWNNSESYDSYFENLAKRINSLADYEPNKRLSYSGLSYLLYPKKDKISISGIDDVLVDETNVFIDAPIWVHLIDILFILNIYDLTPEKFETGYMYGTVFDPEFKSTNQKNRTPNLFENHSSNYEAWKQKPFSKFFNSDHKNAYLIKFDLRRCFYNFEFDIKSFIREVFENDCDNLLCELETEIHNYYTSIFNKDFKNSGKIANRSILPIGLLSSSVILNYYLSEFDIELGPECISYGRYADDFLILVEYSDLFLEIKDKKELIRRMFPDAFLLEGDDLYLINGTRRLLLNKNKLLVFIIDKDDPYGFKKKLSQVASASYIEDSDNKRESPVDAEVMTIASLRGWLFDYSKTLEQKQQFFSRLNDAGLINAYPLWRHILPLDIDGYIEKRIINAIGKISINTDDEFLTHRSLELIKSILNYELEFAKVCKENGGEYKKRLFIDIEQPEIFKFIESYSTLRYVCMPISITKSEIMFYLQTHDDIEVSEKLISKTEELYSHINYLSEKEGTTFKINKVPNNCLTIVESRFEKNDGNPRVAVVNLQIDTKDDLVITKYDLDSQPPSNLSFSDICNIIDSAAENGASYILLPEFSILFDKAFAIISLCYKKKVSLIAGLTHYRFTKGTQEFAYNCTLIYSFPLKKPFIHKKRYLSEKERRILEKRRIIGLDSTKNYLIIRDKVLSYSVMTCYEATNINDRASFRDQGLDAVFLPVYNRDTNYFSAIIESFSRDISAYIIQSNVNEYGDSRITGPLKSFNKDLVRVKGGINHYYVIGELSFGERDEYKKHEEELKLLRKRVLSPTYFDDINGCISAEKGSIENFKWKPTSANQNNQITKEGDDDDFIF